VAAPMSAMLGPADTFWARLLDLTATEPDLLGAVCHHLSSVEKQSLHGANRVMRTAMNATVTSISCTQHTLPTHQRLHEVFPNLSSMALCILGTDDQYIRVDEWRGYLRQLESNSEPLLNKLRHLSLKILSTDMADEAGIQAILQLLTKCATRGAASVSDDMSCHWLYACMRCCSTRAEVLQPIAAARNNSPCEGACLSFRVRVETLACLCCAAPWRCGPVVLHRRGICLASLRRSRSRITMT
jgi:hypothetical protein